MPDITALDEGTMVGKPKLPYLTLGMSGIKSMPDLQGCYKLLYDNALFKTVRFKNKRIYWIDQFDFHLDQILERGHVVKVDEKAQVA